MIMRSAFAAIAAATILCGSLSQAAAQSGEQTDSLWDDVYWGAVEVGPEVSHGTMSFVAAAYLDDLTEQERRVANGLSPHIAARWTHSTITETFGLDSLSPEGNVIRGALGSRVGHYKKLHTFSHDLIERTLTNHFASIRPHAQLAGGAARPTSIAAGCAAWMRGVGWLSLIAFGYDFVSILSGDERDSGIRPTIATRAMDVEDLFASLSPSSQLSAVGHGDQGVGQDAGAGGEV